MHMLLEIPLHSLSYYFSWLIRPFRKPVDVLKDYTHDCLPFIYPASPHVFYFISSFQLSYVSYHSVSYTSMCGRITPWHTFFLLRLAVRAR